ncbi:MAG TPA: 5'-3' exonuclease H3TH domain-containing protein [Candidatus Peribacteraceae bacterium]|nr:5'-3' exonuclease H3TH domain-containing protein [Candidatus Peribacteraceae bacterium]
MPHLVLIDGHHLMYRAYWAIPRTLKTSKGEQVNTVFGMASMLLHILKKEEPDAFLICFDAGEETFRHVENATYKDGRAETPDDFYVQIPRVVELIEAFQFQHVSNPKYEADDLLGTYACAGEKEGMKVTIVTGDRDAFQLATDNIRIAIPHSGYLQAEYLGPADIEAKYGIRPDQVPAYKGLVGDASDNLPGVNGIGPKGAAKLLQDYGTLEAIYEHLDDIRPAIREKLERDREQAFFCQRMAELVCDIPLDPPLERLRLAHLPADKILDLFSELEFTLLTRRFREFFNTAYGRTIFDIESLPKIEQTPTSKTDQLSLF